MWHSQPKVKKHDLKCKKKQFFLNFRKKKFFEFINFSDRRPGLLYRLTFFYFFFNQCSFYRFLCIFKINVSKHQFCYVFELFSNQLGGSLLVVANSESPHKFGVTTGIRSHHMKIRFSFSFLVHQNIYIVAYFGNKNFCFHKILF